MKVVIITGLSGAGRSRAANWFEDQGYYCVDNMPPALISNFLEMVSVDSNRIEKVAFVTDLRSRNFFEVLTNVIDELKKNTKVELTVLFLEASTSEIVKRYNEVRRNHPLTSGVATLDVIENEKKQLSNIRDKADFVLDTTSLKITELYAELDKMILGGEGARKFSINISSFGFKYGIPSETDIMFDVRFLPNPYYVSSLKKLSGNNKKVREYIFKSPLASQFIDSVRVLINSLIDGYILEGKYHLNIAFGCTGGHHRSVAIANAIAKEFENKDHYRINIHHRDLDLMAKGK